MKLNLINLILTLGLIVFGINLNAQQRQMGGYTELEVYIPNLRNNVTVSIDGQSISNNKGVFKFENITPGVNEIVIAGVRGIMFNGRIEIKNNRKTIAEYSKTRGLEIVEVLYIQMQNNQRNDVVRHIQPMRDRRIYEHYEDRNPHIEYRVELNVMDNRTYQDFRATVRNQSFSSTKVDLIRTAVMNNWFTTDQVGGLLDELSFESDKLNVAKMCYDKVVDKENYFKINNKFSFSSSVTELSKYTMSR